MINNQEQINNIVNALYQINTNNNRNKLELEERFEALERKNREIANKFKQIADILIEEGENII